MIDSIIDNVIQLIWYVPKELLIGFICLFPFILLGISDIRSEISDSFFTAWSSFTKKYSPGTTEECVRVTKSTPKSHKRFFWIIFVIILILVAVVFN